jgi:EPS-associated MarR family transcriptional regulator
MPSEAHLKVLRCIEDNPEISQRQIADALGISLGKTNYCVRALLEKGWIKARNFKNSKNKVAYAYILTPQGIEQKTQLAYQFLKRKQIEFEALKREIDLLSREAGE